MGGIHYSPTPFKDYRSHCEAPQCKVVMNLTSSSHFVEFKYQCQQMPLLFHKNGFLYSDRIILYLQLSRLTNMINYSTRTATVRVIQLESIPLGRLPPHYRESHTLIRITKICSVTELVQAITPAQFFIQLSKRKI